MRQVVSETGDFGIGMMIHVVHMTDDVVALDRFYEEVFGGLLYMGVDEPDFLEVEDRYASLLLVSDLCIEPMAPNRPVNTAKPVGRFYSKYGQHLHSVGYKVSDLVGLGDRLIHEGIGIAAPGGGRLEKMDPATIYFYPSPRDMQGLMVELCRVDMPADPRLLNTWSSQRRFWELSHPLGIKRLAHITVGVKDLDAACETYVGKMQARHVCDGVDGDSRARSAILHLGGSLLQLAQPLDDQSPLGQHVAQWGNLIYRITFQVNDLDDAEAWLNKKDIGASRPRPGLLAASPEDCHGVPFCFTTDVIPNDPLDA